LYDVHISGWRVAASTHAKAADPALWQPHPTSAPLFSLRKYSMQPQAAAGSSRENASGTLPVPNSKR
jgi:hypothetical protein